MSEHGARQGYTSPAGAGIVRAMTGCCDAPLWTRWTEPRCTGCGHRQPVDGVLPRQTREKPPWMWPAEVLGRYLARRAGRKR